MSLWSAEYNKTDGIDSGETIRGFSVVHIPMDIKYDGKTVFSIYNESGMIGLMETADAIVEKLNTDQIKPREV